MLTRTLEYTPPGAGQPRAIAVSVAGFDAPYATFIHGVDPIQALLMALWLVPDLLGTLADRGGLVTRLGSDDLGFRYTEPPPDAG